MGLHQWNLAFDKIKKHAICPDAVVFRPNQLFALKTLWVKTYLSGLQNFAWKSQISVFCWTAEQSTSTNHFRCLKICIAVCCMISDNGIQEKKLSLVFFQKFALKNFRGSRRRRGNEISNFTIPLSTVFVNSFTLRLVFISVTITSESVCFWREAVSYIAVDFCGTQQSRPCHHDWWLNFRQIVCWAPLSSRVLSRTTVGGVGWRVGRDQQIVSITAIMWWLHYSNLSQKRQSNSDM